jgi:hypothetical protein
MKSDKIQIEILVSIWRHWVWADRMRDLFKYYYDDEFSQLSKEAIANPAIFWTNSTMTVLFLWYGLLYVVCEGIETELDVDINTIAPAFKKIKGRLKNFRNAVFHVQPKVWSPKLEEVLNDPTIAGEIHSIHDGIGQWLKEQLKTINTLTEPESGS